MGEKVAIIVLNYNGLRILGSKLLRRCLNSILNTDYRDFVVIFVDNGSTDGSTNFVEEEFHEYIDAGLLHILKLNKNYGWSGGNNRGALYALKLFKPDYLAFLNNDLYVVSRDWLKASIRVTQSYSIHVVSPLIYEIKLRKYNVGNIVFGDGGSIAVAFTEKDLRRMLSKGRQVLELPAVHGCAMIVYSEVFKRLGGFDEGFRAYYDETDFCFRARRRGYQVAAVIDPNTKVLHFGGLTIEGIRYAYDKKAMYTVESSLRFTYKHYGLKSSIRCILSNVRWLIAELYRLNLPTVLGIAFGFINGVRRLMSDSRYAANCK